MSYAMHIGRVGALAVALGIGIAVASTPGTAWADDASTDSSDSAEDTGPSGTSNETRPTPADSGAASGAEGITPSAASASPAPPGARQSRPRVIFGSGRGPHTNSPMSAESVSGGNETANPVLEADGEKASGTATLVDEDSKTAPQVSVPVEAPSTGQRSVSGPKKQSERAPSSPSLFPASVAATSAKPTASRKAGGLVPQGQSTDIKEPGDGVKLTVVAPLAKSAPTTAPAEVATIQMTALGLTALATDTPTDPSAPPLAALLTLVMLRRQFNQRQVEESTNYAPTGTTLIVDTDPVTGDLGIATMTAEAASRITATGVGPVAKPIKPIKPPKATQPLNNDTRNAVNDTVTTNEDTPVSGNVLANDTDPDKNALTVHRPGTEQPTHGTLVMPDGSFTYTPTADYNGDPTPSPTRPATARSTATSPPCRSPSTRSTTPRWPATTPTPPTRTRR